MRLPRSCLVLILPLVLAACQREAPAPVEVVRPVRSVIVQPESVSTALRLPGELRPRVETAYGFRIGGRVAQRLVSVGDPVASGQVLARLDPADSLAMADAAQASLAAARTDARLAAAELARQQSLRAQGFISAASLERFQANAQATESRVQAAEAQLRQARNAVTDQVLRAQAAGHVATVDVEAGQVVAPGQPVVRVAHSGEIEVRVDVPEHALEAARRSAQWEVRVPAIGEASLPARVREISPVADPASRTYPMRLSLAGDQAGLALGMSAVASAVADDTQAFVLPVSALHTLNDQPRVWRVDPATSTVQPVSVRTAGLDGDRVRIVEGLKAGDRVVTAGANLLEAGQRVRVPDGQAAR